VKRLIKEYGKRVAEPSRAKAEKSQLGAYKAKASTKSWATKKTASLDSWTTKKKAAKKPVRATKAKGVTKKKKAAR
jgi:hypothetical protein